MSKCGNETLLQIFNKRPKSKSIPPNFITQKNLPNNPYCSSITGQFAFDLSKINNFKVYFWTASDNINKNEAIKEILTLDKTRALTWSPFYQIQTLKTLEQYTSFTNSSYTLVPNYDECDIVCVLGDKLTFLGACFGPYFLYNDPEFVNNKVVFFLSNQYTNNANITEGGEQYITLIHEFGHGFGLAHPHDDGFGSTIMPGIATDRSVQYPAICAYIQNTAFNTVMTYNDIDFFLPPQRDFKTNRIGYPETLMPLDLLSIRWLYNIEGTSTNYVEKYGVKLINPDTTSNKSKTIVGNNQEITFGPKCLDISFYFSNQCFTYNNINPFKYEYNRILEKPYSFFPKDISSTVSTLNLLNLLTANIFIEKNAVKVDLTINLLQNKILNLYIEDCEKNYVVNNNIYTNLKTLKVIRIVNVAKAEINIFFNK